MREVPGLFDVNPLRRPLVWLFRFLPLRRQMIRIRDELAYLEPRIRASLVKHHGYTPMQADEFLRTFKARAELGWLNAAEDTDGQG